MKLRGHHLFCTALFSGHGYDGTFTEKMAAVIEALKAGEPIELLTGPDEICSACPNRMDPDGCALGTEDVFRRDEGAFQVLGLAPHATFTWEQVKSQLFQINEIEFQSVCGDCRWQKEGLCTLELLLKRTSIK